MRQLIFDSSFLMAVAEHPTRWMEDTAEAIGSFQPVLLDCVKSELETISEGRGKRAAMARVALDLSAGFQPGPSGQSNPDDEITSAALRGGAAVATVDQRLVDSLRAMKVQVVRLSQGRVVRA